MNNDFFDGYTAITVSTDTLNPVRLIEAVTSTLSDIYDDRHMYDEILQDVYRADSHYGDEELGYILSDLSDELEAVANKHGYTYGTLEGDGAHFVLAPLSSFD